MRLLVLCFLEMSGAVETLPHEKSLQAFLILLFSDTMLRTAVISSFIRVSGAGRVAQAVRV
jgi:hypothetical protein